MTAPAPAFAPRHVVASVDADAASEVAVAEHLVDAAADLARVLGARLTLVHVALAAVEPPVLPPDPSGELSRTMVDVLEARNMAAGRALQALLERAQARGVAAESLLIRKGGTVPELVVAAAQELGADLLVLATHGRKGLRRLVLGSIAERTAHLSTCAVLLLPAHH